MTHQKKPRLGPKGPKGSSKGQSKAHAGKHTSGSSGGKMYHRLTGK